MAGDLGKLGVAGVLLVIIAMILIALVGPMIHAMQEAASDSSLSAFTQFEAESKHAELAAFLRAELRNNRIADPYNPLWWHKKLTNREYGMLEKALNDFLGDTELDGQAEAELYEALRQVGINVSNLADAVHAANHFVNKTKAPEGEPLPDQVKEDYKDGE